MASLFSKMKGRKKREPDSFKLFASDTDAQAISTKPKKKKREGPGLLSALFTPEAYTRDRNAINAKKRQKKMASSLGDIVGDFAVPGENARAATGLHAMYPDNADNFTMLRSFLDSDSSDLQSMARKQIGEYLRPPQQMRLPESEWREGEEAGTGFYKNASPEMINYLDMIMQLNNSGISELQDMAMGEIDEIFTAQRKPKPKKPDEWEAFQEYLRAQGKIR